VVKLARPLIGNELTMKYSHALVSCSALISVAPPLVSEQMRSKTPTVLV